MYRKRNYGSYGHYEEPDNKTSLDVKIAMVGFSLLCIAMVVLEFASLINGWGL